MKEKRIFVSRSIFKVPDLFIEEAVVLRVNPHFFIKGDIHRPGSSLPLFDLGDIQTGPVHQYHKTLRVFLSKRLDRRCRVPQVLLRHEIGIGVIVHEGVVFIRSCHAIDAELAALPPGIESEIIPQAGRFHQHLSSLLVEKGLVTCCLNVLPQTVHDVRIDVILGRSRRIVR